MRPDVSIYECVSTPPVRAHPAGKRGGEEAMSACIVTPINVAPVNVMLLMVAPAIKLLLKSAPD